MQTTDSNHARGFAARAAALATVLGLLAFAGGCSRPPVSQENVSMASLSDVPDSAWAQLRARRIWFGHQSVGGNIMQGVAELAAADPKLGIVPVEGPPAESGAAFAHAPVGRNGDPGLKTDDFARVLEGGAAARLDIAFHKYCYADIVDTTDVDRVFAHYHETMARLESEYPGVTFVHVTAPLTMVQSGPVAEIKKLLGRAPGRYASNFKRERFNQMMRSAYGPGGRLFDLAAVESTRPDGSREAIRLGGRKGYALYPGYSSDGSHLNEAGRRRAAEQLLVMLAQLPANH
jgi:hypothetical protein